jgi:hypothetical protein
VEGWLAAVPGNVLLKRQTCLLGSQTSLVGCAVKRVVRTAGGPERMLLSPTVVLSAPKARWNSPEDHGTESCSKSEILFAAALSWGAGAIDGSKLKSMTS